MEKKKPSSASEKRHNSVRPRVNKNKALKTRLQNCTKSAVGCTGSKLELKQVNVVFRFDDYSACSNTDMELRIIDAFRKHEACFTLGVIPYVCANDIHDPSAQDLIPLTPIKGNILKNGVNEDILEDYIFKINIRRIEYAEHNAF